MAKAAIQLQSSLMSLSGELDFASVTQLWQTSQSWFMQQSSINIDLAKVTRTNSAGLALFVAWQQLAVEHKKTIQFVNCPEQMQSLIHVYELGKILNLTADLPG